MRAEPTTYPFRSTKWKGEAGSRSLITALGALVAAVLTSSTAAADVSESANLRAEADARVNTILALQPDDAYGAYLAGDCAVCHRASGGAGIPPIAGLPAEHIVNALVEYKLGIRDNEVMVVRMSRLDDEEIAALASHFAAQDP